MQTITIDELLNHNADPDGEIYVLRDGDCPLYAGKTTAGIAYRWLDNFGGRLYQDVGGKWHSKDYTGEMVVMMMPRSLEWQLDCYPKREAIDKYLPTYKEIFLQRAGYEYAGVPDLIGLSTAELMCIESLRPCFNAQLNSNPRPIPDYIDEVRAGRSRKVSRAVLDSIYIPE
jgi:hypothetical protein